MRLCWHCSFNRLNQFKGSFKVRPFKWKLQSSIFLTYSLLCCRFSLLSLGGWNPKVWPFKWKLLSRTFQWCCLSCCKRWAWLFRVRDGMESLICVPFQFMLLLGHCHNKSMSKYRFSYTHEIFEDRNFLCELLKGKEASSI